MNSAELFSLAQAHTDNPMGIDIVRKAALRAFRGVDVSHPSLEFGTCRGGSAIAVLSAMVELQQPSRPIVTVDPYGNLPYYADVFRGVKMSKPVSWAYPNDLYRVAMETLSSVAKHEGLNWTHYMMRDTDYMEHVWPGVPLYFYKEPVVRPMFSFVYLDAEHTEESVRRQLVWLGDKIVKGGTIVIDDVDFLNGRGDSILAEFGGQVIEKDHPDKTRGCKKWLVIER